MISLTKIIEVIDKMADEIPDIGKEFIRESRKFWAAKSDIFDSKNECLETKRLYPGMASFHNLEEFQDYYSERIPNHLLSKAMSGEISHLARYLIKSVARRFEKIEPYDNTILPIVEKISNRIIEATIILPTDEKVSIPYFEE